RRRILADDAIRMVHAKDKVSFSVGSAFAVLPPSLADGEFVGAEGVLGPEITRTDAVSAAEQAWRFLRLQRRQDAAKFLHFMSFAEGHANVARERIVPGQTFVGAFDDNNVLLAAQRIDHGGFGEWADDVDMNRANFGIALLAQVVTGSVDVFSSATERNENRVSVLSSIFGDQTVMAASQL